MLVSVYGGPSSNGLNENFVNANPLAEYGFLIVKLDARTNLGRGRKVLDTTYKQLGIAEIDDIAAGIRALWSRPYVDRERVGMYGTSYGGTVAAAMVLRHPDAVQAAVGKLARDGLPALRHGLFRAASRACRRRMRTPMTGRRCCRWPASSGAT
jgi:dipeptidyl-peptidase-4